jgi:hypothetical protein
MRYPAILPLDVPNVEGVYATCYACLAQHDSKMAYLDSRFASATTKHRYWVKVALVRMSWAYLSAATAFSRIRSHGCRYGNDRQSWKNCLNA